MSETPPMCISSSWVDLSNEVSSGLYSTVGGAGQEGGAGGAGHSSQPSSRTTPVPFGSDQVTN